MTPTVSERSLALDSGEQWIIHHIVYMYSFFTILLYTLLFHVSSYINTIISGEFQDNPYGEGQNFDDYYPYVPVDPASEDGGNDSGWNSIPLYGRALIITVFGCVAAAVAAILYTKLRISKSATKETDGIILLN